MQQLGRKLNPKGNTVQTENAQQIIERLEREFLFLKQVDSDKTTMAQNDDLINNLLSLEKRLNQIKKNEFVET